MPFQRRLVESWEMIDRRARAVEVWGKCEETGGAEEGW